MSRIARVVAQFTDVPTANLGIKVGAGANVSCAIPTDDWPNAWVAALIAVINSKGAPTNTLTLQLAQDGILRATNTHPTDTTVITWPAWMQDVFGFGASSSLAPAAVATGFRTHRWGIYPTRPPTEEIETETPLVTQVRSTSRTRLETVNYALGKDLRLVWLWRGQPRGDGTWSERMIADQFYADVVTTGELMRYHPDRSVTTPRDRISEPWGYTLARAIISGDPRQIEPLDPAWYEYWRETWAVAEVVI